VNVYPVHVPISILVTLATLSCHGGEFTVADVFTDRMVLQRNIDVPVWGTAQPGAVIAVDFSGEKATAKADANGNWRLSLSPMPASSVGKEMTLTSRIGSDVATVKFSDVLVGEVWLCSGQSNMEWTINAKDHLSDPAEIVKEAVHPDIRFFTTKTQYCAKPYSRCGGQWRECSPENAGELSATAYFFARKLNRELKVPVGLLVSAVGGTVGHCWIPGEAMLRVPALRQFTLSPDQVAHCAQGYEGFDEKYRHWLGTEEAKAVIKDDAEAEKIRQDVLRQIKDANEAEATGAPYPYNYWGYPMEVRKLAGFDQDLRISTNRGASLFNGMIAPLAPFAMAGILWWQGEADADWSHGAIYADKLCVLADSWRAFWTDQGFGRGVNLPFIYVQLENFQGRDGINADEWARLRDSQRQCADRIANSCMVVAIDASPPEDAPIHPRDKKMIGDRLCAAALALAYAGDVSAAQYPLYCGMKAAPGGIVVEFKHAPMGLQPGRDGKDVVVKGFEIAGADGNFKPATATIEGGSVVVSSLEVPHPVAVRYSWGINPDGNLYGCNGLPASPFLAAGQ
jgi:sialate O-acetylesterase